MDIVLGVSMAPESVQMILLQGENADGTTVDESEFAVTADDDSPTVSASDRVIAAIVATRDDAASAGLELSAVGVACTDELEAAALRDALTAHKMENVMLVSAFLAATALTQSVGGAMGYERTAVLLVEPQTATLAVVETADGSVVDVHTDATAELSKLIAGLDELPTRPGGLLVVGRGVDIASIKSLAEEATSLAVSTPEEPETALARGAALASANAPLFASSTAALAYERDPEFGEDGLAYSAAADDEASAPTVVIAGTQRRRPVLLVGSALAVAGMSAVIALEVALTVGTQPTTVGLLPAPLRGIIAPFEQVSAPAPGHVAATNAVAPKPLGAPAAAPVPAAPPPAGPVPAVPVPAAAVPAAPVPVAPVPAAPVPAEPAVPVPVVIPPIAVPPIHVPEPPASPPVVHVPPPHWSPPAEPPPVHVPPPHQPPPHEPPPGQGPWPTPGGHGGPPENSGGPQPVHGPGPVHGNPPGGGPDGGGPINSPGPSHGIPGGTPPESGVPPGGGAPPEHGSPVGGGEPPGGGAPSEHSGPVGGGETPSGGVPSGSEPSSGGAPSVGSEPSSGGAPSVGSESSSGSAPSVGSESSSSASSGDSGGHR